jgi:hypothetical protein
MYGRQITPSRLGKLEVFSEDEFKPTHSLMELVQKVMYDLKHMPFLG